MKNAVYIDFINGVKQYVHMMLIIPSWIFARYNICGCIRVTGNIEVRTIYGKYTVSIFSL